MSEQQPTKPIVDAQKAGEALAASVITYKPNEEAHRKITEFLQKRVQCIDTIKKIDESVMQLRYGISQELVRQGSNGCNGFGKGFDHSDYACRILCKSDIRDACKQLVKSKNSKSPTEQIDIEINKFQDDDPNSRPAKGF